MPLEIKRNNYFRYYDIILDSKFKDEEILDYLVGLRHNPNCSRLEKDRYYKGDYIVGEVDIRNIGYLIYSCSTCSGMYFREGRAPGLRMGER